MTDVKEVIEDENKIDTVIADDIEFRGKLIFKDSLKLKGFFEGKIETKGHLIIGQEATVNADIKANIVSISGIVNGWIKATKSILLFSNSKTKCDLVTPDIYIEQGSSFNGTCIMAEKEEKKN
ncbi:MAG: polymer-forming cytoskeletal protein [Spirochaetota bacterium]|nr:polymer-forming cytoskeletal protein [Spirochaetota bacterium]